MSQTIDYSTLSPSRFMMMSPSPSPSPPTSPMAAPLSTSSPYSYSYAHGYPQPPPPLPDEVLPRSRNSRSNAIGNSSRSPLFTIREDEETETSIVGGGAGGDYDGDGDQVAADSFEFGGGRTRTSTYIDSRGDDWANQSIFHGTILEESSMADELEERALQIAELKLKLIGALKSQRKLQRQRELMAGSSANNSKTSLICNTSGTSGGGAEQSQSVANFATPGRETSGRLFASVMSEIEDCYERSRVGVGMDMGVVWAFDENENLVRISRPNPEDEEFDMELDLTTAATRGGRGASGQVEDESLRQHLVRWVERSVNREDVLEKVGTLSVAASQLLAGDLAGWFAAYIVQKFGKVTLTAVGGGLILLKIAHHKGYILVNWSNIYNQLEQVAVNEGQEGVLDDWVTHKVKSFKTWAHNNSYIVIGFMCGFLYKTFG